MASRLSLLITSVAVLAASGCSDNSEPAISAVEEAVPGYLERLHAPGMAVAVIRNGELVWAEGFGLTGVEADSAPVTHRTVFEFASLSKPVFAAIAAGQAQEGVYDLDEPLGPAADFPRIADPEAFTSVTPRMILSHGTTLPNWADEAGGPLEFSGTPGSRFRYSGEAYGLLQSMLERRTRTKRRGRRQTRGSCGAYAKPMDKNPSRCSSWSDSGKLFMRMWRQSVQS